MKKLLAIITTLICLIFSASTALPDDGFVKPLQIHTIMITGGTEFIATYDIDGDRRWDCGLFLNPNLDGEFILLGVMSKSGVKKAVEELEKKGYDVIWLKVPNTL